MRGCNKCECFSRFAIIEFAIEVLCTWGRVQVGPKRNSSIRNLLENMKAQSFYYVFKCGPTVSPLIIPLIPRYKGQTWSSPHARHSIHPKHGSHPGMAYYLFH